MLQIADNEPAVVRNIVMREADKREIECEVAHLVVGDYLWDKSIVVERKSVPDYIASVRDGRLFSQALDMEQYFQSYVVVHGSFKGIEFNPYLRDFKVAHKLGSMGSLVARTKTKLVQVDNQTQFVELLFILKEKATKGHKTFVVERHSKTISRLDPNVALFLSIPGVGPMTVRQLSKEYETFFELLNEVRKNKFHYSLTDEGKKFLKLAVFSR